MYMRLYEILDIIEAVKMPFFTFKYLKVELKEKLMHCVLFND